jgi:hypothetical protein
MCCQLQGTSHQCSAQAAATPQRTTACEPACPASQAYKHLLTTAARELTETTCARCPLASSGSLTWSATAPRACIAPTLCAQTTGAPSPACLALRAGPLQRQQARQWACATVSKLRLGAITAAMHTAADQLIHACQQLQCCCRLAYWLTSCSALVSERECVALKAECSILANSVPLPLLFPLLPCSPCSAAARLQARLHQPRQRAVTR